MNIIDAAYETVHGYEHGGSPAIALRMGGMSPNVLNSKVSASNTTHHLRLDEALKIMEFTNNDAIIHAMAHQLGGVYCRVNAAASESELLMTAIFSSACQGDVMATMREALADGVIDRKEGAVIQVALQSAMSVLAGLSGQIENHIFNQDH